MFSLTQMMAYALEVYLGKVILPDVFDCPINRGACILNEELLLIYSKSLSYLYAHTACAHVLLCDSVHMCACMLVVWEQLIIVTIMSRGIKRVGKQWM